MKIFHRHSEVMESLKKTSRMNFYHLIAQPKIYSSVYFLVLKSAEFDYQLTFTRMTFKLQREKHLRRSQNTFSCKDAQFLHKNVIQSFSFPSSASACPDPHRVIY